MSIRRKQEPHGITPEKAGEDWVDAHDIINKLQALLPNPNPKVSAAATHYRDYADSEGRKHRRADSYSIPKGKEHRYVNGILAAIKKRRPRWLAKGTVVRQPNGVCMVTVILQHAN